MLAERLHAALAGVTDPFPGLRPFENDEEPIFRGRQQHTDELLLADSWFSDGLKGSGGNGVTGGTVLWSIRMSPFSRQWTTEWCMFKELTARSGVNGATGLTAIGLMTMSARSGQSTVTSCMLLELTASSGENAVTCLTIEPAASLFTETVEASPFQHFVQTFVERVNWRFRRSGTTAVPAARDVCVWPSPYRPIHELHERDSGVPRLIM
jgi:hypothetical protein